MGNVCTNAPRGNKACWDCNQLGHQRKACQARAPPIGSVAAPPSSSPPPAAPPSPSALPSRSDGEQDAVAPSAASGAVPPTRCIGAECRNQPKAGATLCTPCTKARAAQSASGRPVGMSPPVAEVPAGVDEHGFQRQQSRPGLRRRQDADELAGKLAELVPEKHRASFRWKASNALFAGVSVAVVTSAANSFSGPPNRRVCVAGVFCRSYDCPLIHSLVGDKPATSAPRPSDDVPAPASPAPANTVKRPAAGSPAVQSSSTASTAGTGSSTGSGVSKHAQKPPEKGNLDASRKATAPPPAAGQQPREAAAASAPKPPAAAAAPSGSGVRVGAQLAVVSAADRPAAAAEAPAPPTESAEARAIAALSARLDAIMTHISALATAVQVGASRESRAQPSVAAAAGPSVSNAAQPSAPAAASGGDIASGTDAASSSAATASPPTSPQPETVVSVAAVASVAPAATNLPSSL